MTCEVKEHKRFIMEHPYCEMCGCSLIELLCVHHILKKGRYTEYRNDKRNWARLCWKCHLLTENGGIYKGKKVSAKEFNDQIKIKHNINPANNKFV